MSLATPINKFILNDAKIPLKEIKDMKIDCRDKKNQKNMKTDDNHRSVDNVRSESAQAD